MLMRMTEMVAQTSRYARPVRLHRLTDMSEQQYGRRAVETGPTGETVAANLTRLRKARGFSTRQLSAAMEAAGRPISPSGILRMEKADRHVTSDDLVAFAAVFNVSPAALLLPLRDSGAEALPITGAGRVPADVAWAWMSNERPLRLPDGDSRAAILDYRLYSLPPGRRPGGLYAPGERSDEALQAKRELFERMASWGAIDLEAEKRRDPEPWEET
jgi:transcriptional regulator with XRE-family HTH domain